jgi:hypothetical protein
METLLLFNFSDFFFPIGFFTLRFLSVEMELHFWVCGRDSTTLSFEFGYMEVVLMRLVTSLRLD